MISQLSTEVLGFSCELSDQDSAILWASVYFPERGNVRSERQTHKERERERGTEREREKEREMGSKKKTEREREI